MKWYEHDFGLKPTDGKATGNQLDIMRPVRIREVTGFGGSNINPYAKYREYNNTPRVICINKKKRRKLRLKKRKKNRETLKQLFDIVLSSTQHEFKS